MQYVDNYKETVEKINNFVKGNIGELPTDNSWSVSGAWEFRTANAQAYLYVRLVDSRDYEHITDDEGNVWNEFGVSVTINYPSYGSDVPGVVKERINLIDQVVELAEKVMKEFSYPVYRLSRSKEQAAKDALETKLHGARQHIIDSLQNTIVCGMNIISHMRVGHSRPLSKDIFQNVDDGEYKIEIKDKTYKVCVNHEACHVVTRVS